MPAWAEILIRLVMAAAAAYLQSQGHPVGAVTALSGAALADLPFRTTSTGASSGRVEEAKKAAIEVVQEKVDPAAQRP